MKPGEQIILAAKKQAEGELEVHKANIAVYQTMPAGIGEHSDLLTELDKYVTKLAAAEDNLESLERHKGTLIETEKGTAPLLHEHGC